MLLQGPSLANEARAVHEVSSSVPNQIENTLAGYPKNMSYEYHNIITYKCKDYSIIFYSILFQIEIPVDYIVLELLCQHK